MTTTQTAQAMIEAYGSAKAAAGEAWITYNRMWREERYTDAAEWAEIARAIALLATEMAKLDRLEARAALSLPHPGPAAEFVQYAKGVVGGEIVEVRIVNGRMHYETYTGGMRKLTRAEVLRAIAA